MKYLLIILALAITGCGSRSEEPTTGPIEGAVHVTDSMLRFKAVRHEVDLEDLSPWLGLPLSGTAIVDADLRVPRVRNREDWRQARGRIEVRCPDGCSLGNNLAKLQPPGTSTNQKRSIVDGFVGDGVEFGRLVVDNLDAELTFADGKAELTSFVMRSPDVRVEASFHAQLAPALGQSAVAACVRFHATEDLLARDPTMHALLDLVGGALGSDGLFHVSVSGPLGQLRYVGRPCE